jgi:membrane-bound ClpP family serine protease
MVIDVTGNNKGAKLGIRRAGSWCAVAMVLAASTSVHAGSRPAVVIPLHGAVDEFLVESFHTRWQKAASGTFKLTVDIEEGKEDEPAAEVTAGTPQVVLLDLHVDGGTLDSAIQLADAIHKLHDEGVQETAALVHKPGSAAGTLLALAADALYMAPGARLMPLDPKSFNASASEEAKKKLLDAVERYSARRPRLKTLYRALVDPALDVQAVELEGREGQTLFLTSTELRQRLSQGDTAIVSSTRVAKKSSLPELDATKAEAVHLSRDTLETIGAVATQLGITSADLRTLSQKGDRETAPAAPGQAEGEETVEPVVPPAIPDTGPVVVMPLTGMVGDGWEHSVERRLEDVEAMDPPPALLIFEMDTYGGKLMNAFEISNRIFDLRDVRTVVYVNRKAISAGAFISVSADEIIMHRGSTLGDCQIVTQGGEAVRSEKIDTVLRADFRKFCRGKYPIALAEAMVMQNYEVHECVTHDGKTEYLKGQTFKNLTPTERERYKTTKRIIDSQTLLTMTDTEAEKYGFSKGSVDSLSEVLEHYGVADREVVEMPMNWSESLVRTLDMVGPLLLTLGILGIIIELKTPGFGVFGLVGLALVMVWMFLIRQ